VQNNKENKTGKLLNTQHHHFQKSSKDSLKSTHCLVFSLSPSTPILKNNVLFHFCFAFRQLFFAQNRPNRETMNNTSQILNLIPFIFIHLLPSEYEKKVLVWLILLLVVGGNDEVCQPQETRDSNQNNFLCSDVFFHWGFGPNLDKDPMLKIYFFNSMPSTKLF